MRRADPCPRPAAHPLLRARAGWGAWLGLGLLGACGLDPAKVPDHSVYASNGSARVADQPVVFGVVGNTRTFLPALDRAQGNNGATEGVTEAIVLDLEARAKQGMSFVVHMGDGVRKSSQTEWSDFAETFSDLIDGETPPAGETNQRLRVVPVAGDRDSAGDSRYVGWGGAFPDAGAEIGYNRVATWYTFDLDAQGTTWRMIVLDTDKASLGSRWGEQMAWIPTAMKGDFDALLVFMHEPLYDLGGAADGMNKDGAPAALLERIDDEEGGAKLKAVFSSGSHTSAALLPLGPYGALHVNAGGGGAPGADLRRWGAGDKAGLAEDIQLEALFDLSIMKQLDARIEDEEIPDVVVDQARAAGSFEGFVGTYDAVYSPTYGWWQVTLYKDVIDVRFHMVGPDLSLMEVYSAGHSESGGWKGRLGG